MHSLVEVDTYGSDNKECIITGIARPDVPNVDNEILLSSDISTDEACIGNTGLFTLVVPCGSVQEQLMGVETSLFSGMYSIVHLCWFICCIFVVIMQL